MTKAELVAWRERWRLVNEFSIREALAASMEQRLRDLEWLFALATASGHQDEDDGVAEVRQRWVRLRERSHAR